MPIKHNARVYPNLCAIGRMRKLPTTPPILIDVATNVASSNVNVPVGNVVFSFCNSMKLIVAHPDDRPNVNDNRLPISDENVDLLFT